MVSARQRERGWRSVPATFPGTGFRPGHALMVSDGRVDTPTPPSTLPPTAGGRTKGRDGGSARFWPLWASRRVEALKAEMHICMFVSYLVFYLARSSIFQDVQPTAGLPTVCLLQERFRVVQMLTSFHF